MVRRIDDSRHGELPLIEVPRTFHAPADWQPPHHFPELTGVVALDVETKDPGISEGRGSCWPLGGRWPLAGQGFVCGVALCWMTKRIYYPLRHAAGNIVHSDIVFWCWLREQAAKPDVTFVMANATYDTGWLKRHGIVLANPPRDVQVMAFLLDEHRKSYALSALARHYLGRDKQTLLMVDMARALHIANPMANMDKLPAWVVTPYALEDAKLTYDLYWHLLPKIHSEELLPPFDLESQCTEVSVDMRWEGVRIDETLLEGTGLLFDDRRGRALKNIQDMTGVLMQPFENDSAMKALKIENNNVVFGTTATGRDSVAKNVLQGIGSPVAKAILEARMYDKYKSTFVDSMQNFIHHGRVHAEFHSTRNSSSNDEYLNDDSVFGASSGRFASSHPNLQNIPVRTEEGRMIRDCFIPEEGERWVKLDYASQEPRLTVHFANLARIGGRPLRGAADMVARFNANPLLDLHGECGVLMDVPRKDAKTINLALAYGMQGASLCRSLNLPTKWITSRRTGQLVEVAGDAGERLLKKHFEAVPFIKGIFDLAKETAASRGYVKTIIGQRIRFERYGDGNYARVHKALNGVIQGSAGNQMKMALVALRREGLPSNLTVHDEANKSVPKGEEGERMVDRMVEIMEDVLPLAVPVIAEAKTGRSWGHCR
jgi:DNA polymerase I-like protein with 3'-5' exonuclease and polymerase domains